MTQQPETADTADYDQLLRPQDVALIFRVDPKTVTRWANKKRLTSVRTPGGHRRFKKSEIDILLKSDQQ